MYAPLSSKYIFSAPTWILLPLTASTTGTMSIAGTQNTTSTSSFATSGFSSSTRATASLGVLFIFQLPAIIFFLAMILFSLYPICLCAYSVQYCLAKLFTYRLPLQHPAVLFPPEIPEKLRRLWKYVSSYHRIQAGLLLLRNLRLR